MATEITLCLEDDGTMTISAGEKQESPEEQAAEGGNKQPVESIDQALQMIKQMAEEASMAPPAEETEEMPAMGEEPPMEDPMAEEAAMAESFRPGVQGR